MKHRWFVALLFLALASLACQTIMGGGDIDLPTPDEFPTPLPSINDNSNDNANDNENANDNDNANESGGGAFDTSDAGFPIPPDAQEVTDMGEDLLTFQTDMSLEEAMDFYRDVLTEQGYTEREILTVTSDTTFSFVFDGHESGKALVIQGVEFGGDVQVTLSLQDV